MLTKPQDYTKKKKPTWELILRRPSFTMFAVWALWLLLYILPFFEYTHSISVYSALIILLFIAAFCLGDAFLVQCLQVSKNNNSNQREAQLSHRKFFFQIPVHSLQTRVLNRTIKLFAVIGLLGALAFIFGKLIFSGIDFSEGISSARFNRANDILSGNTAKTPWLIYIGLIGFPFGTAAFLIYLLYNSPLSLWTIRLAKLSILSPISIAVINGGRGGIFHLFIMGSAAVYLNRLKGIKAKAILRKLGIIPHICISGFLVYNTYIFESRRVLVGKEDFWALLYDWRTNYFIQPAQWLIDVTQLYSLDKNFIVTTMQSYYYLSSGPAIFGIILDSNIPLNLSFGQYQIPLIGSLLEKFTPELSLRPILYENLKSTETLGLLPSAWGMFYVDFGLFGGLLESFLWGAVSSFVYVIALSKTTLASQLTFCFIVAGIVLSPLIGPLGFSETFFTLAIFIICDKIIKRSFKYRHLPIKKGKI